MGSFTQGDYEYTYGIYGENNVNTVSAKVVNTNKSSYDAIPYRITKEIDDYCTEVSDHDFPYRFEHFYPQTEIRRASPIIKNISIRLTYESESGKDIVEFTYEYDHDAYINNVYNVYCTEEGFSAIRVKTYFGARKEKELNENYEYVKYFEAPYSISNNSSGEPYYIRYGLSNIRVKHDTTFMVNDMTHCFSGCASLITAPTIPNSVIDMNHCFKDCTSLTTAPTIPSSVTNITSCFSGCTSLITAPTIPNSVKYMSGCFGNCTSLTTAPTIPNSVIAMIGCFSGCISLTGNCVINSTDDSYSAIFKNTVKGIWLTGSSNKLTEIAAGYDNVFVGSIPTPKVAPIVSRVGSKFSTTDDVDGEWSLIKVTNWNWADFEENDITGLEISENSAGINPLTWYRQNGGNFEEIDFYNYSPTATDEAYTWILADEFTHTYAISADDKYGEGALITIILPQSKKLLDFKAGGTGIAIGMPAVDDGLHIDFETVFYNSVQKQDMTTAEITAFINELRGITS